MPSLARLAYFAFRLTFFAPASVETSPRAVSVSVGRSVSVLTFQARLAPAAPARLALCEGVSAIWRCEGSGQPQGPKSEVRKRPQKLVPKS